MVPHENGDLLRVVDTGLHVSHMLQPKYIDNCLEFITHNPAKNLGLRGYGIMEGNPANLIVLDAHSEREVLQEGCPVLLSVHRGKRVFLACRDQYRLGVLTCPINITTKDHL